MTTAYDYGSIPTIEVRHRLRIAREHAGLDQQQLAELMSVTRSTISNAEQGRNSQGPRRSTVNAWALACGVPVSWLWTGNTPPTDDDTTTGHRIICSGRPPATLIRLPLRNIRNAA